MHPFSTLTLGIFVAGYITARWDLTTRLYELLIFAWEYGVVVSRRAMHTRYTYTAGGLCLGANAGEHVIVVARGQSPCHTQPLLPRDIYTCGTSGDEGSEPGTARPPPSPSPWYSDHAC